MYLESKERREVILAGASVENLDELAFHITEAILIYLPPKPTPEDYFGIIGVLSATKLEFHRRAFGPFNDQRIALNGDHGYDDLPENKG